jgi:hypothetical protein
MLSCALPWTVQLVDLFGRVRDEWIARDLDDWLSPNRIYPGVAEALKDLMGRDEVYIVTTKQVRFACFLFHDQVGPCQRVSTFKLMLPLPPGGVAIGKEGVDLTRRCTLQARFTEAILRNMAAITFPTERIFSQTVSGQPKSEVLVKLAAAHAGSKCHFIEDKLSTLEKVQSSVPIL